ncbi:MAG: DUF2384 domain-containing protein [Trueperaceae bacterium]|nr:DUF2384 domain-containing protein [Trueperaceae bacterium]
MSVTSWRPGTEVSAPDAAVQDMTARTIAGVLRSPDVNLAAVSARIEAGLPFRVFTELCRALGLTQREFADLLRLSPSTLYRRKASGTFEPDESDRLWRYLHVYARAFDVHEGADAAREWLKAPVAALGGASPLVVAKDDPGVQRVLTLLGRIEHGVFG